MTRDRVGDRRRTFDVSASVRRLHPPVLISRIERTCEGEEPSTRRYFFDIHDDGVTIDEEGQQLSSLEAVRCEGHALPAIAADEIPKNSDRRHLMVFVTDEVGRTVYQATLIFTGLRLHGERRPSVDVVPSHIQRQGKGELSDFKQAQRLR